MIYTVTLNPAVDYVLEVDSIKIGETNRVREENYYIGGKGINVSRVLKELDIPSVALGFAAGFTGDLICSFLEKYGIKSDFVRLDSGFSRINVKIKNNTVTEINGNGPDISKEKIYMLFNKLDAVKDGDLIVLAGSVPQSVPFDIYQKIMERLSGKDIRFAVDATGQLLLDTLKYKPFVIKPNIDELAELFGKYPESEEEILKFANELHKKGARNVIVSLGKEGAVLVDENGHISRVSAHKGNVKNTVGAGDSLLAGFIAGYEKTGDFSYALRLGNAAGAATAFSEDLAKRKRIDEILNNDN
ncbi:MAG: 1-phosphofructokinase [Ruminococcaceae bacterium]|nr:1-phosphofructokinase [Oscillospiraceae bacterium]